MAEQCRIVVSIVKTYVAPDPMANCSLRASAAVSRAQRILKLIFRPGTQSCLSFPAIAWPLASSTSASTISVAKILPNELLPCCANPEKQPTVQDVANEKLYLALGPFILYIGTRHSCAKSNPRRMT
jgi:hypothetical protein